jgi:hypothetical protein
VALASWILVIAVCVSLPAFLIAGWRKWMRHAPQRGIPAACALVGFILGSMSALIAVCSSLYASVRGGFAYYDPALLTIYRIGFLLALGGLISALGGLWKPNALRWYSPAVCIAMIMLWCIWMAGE